MADYVVILGDLMSHNDWELNADKKNEINQFVLDNFRETFWEGKDYKTRDPSTPHIIPLAGNHEGLPENYENYDDPNDFIHKTIFKGFDKIISQDKIDSIVSKAFYTYTDPKRNVKFVVLDSNINYQFNMHASGSPVNPLRIMNNLADTLFESEKKGERVVFLTHISLADYTAQTVFVKFLRVLLQRFRDTISTSLAAPTHKDQFKFYKDEDDQNFLVEFISPSLTTYSGINPQYRVYTFSGNGEVKDYDQFKLNIDVMNMLATQDNFVFEFDLSYSLKRDYEIQAGLQWGRK